MDKIPRDGGTDGMVDHLDGARESWMNSEGGVDGYNFVLASRYDGTTPDANDTAVSAAPGSGNARKPRKLAMTAAERQRKRRAIQYRRERYEEGNPVQIRERVDPLAGLCVYVARDWRGSSQGLRDPRIAEDGHKQCRDLWRRLMRALKDRDKASYTFNEFLFRAIGAYEAFQKDPGDLSRTEHKRVRYSLRRTIAGICEERDLYIAGEVKAALYRETRHSILRDGAALIDRDLPTMLSVPWIDE
ncbi:unnamed protein product [Peniophora sp. CBMAI 1063]|nr:unnamed protein product [Peniophora sp. CBMAI 1063]